MAGTNDFKAFATDANANVTSQEEWETLTALKKGFSSGKASSAQVSKALRQPSTMAAVLGQFIANAELDALDDGDVDGLVAKLATAITTNLGLGEAAKRNVGTGENQIPDMASFASGDGWMKLPNGKILQYGRGAVTPTLSSQTMRITFSIPFPKKADCAMLTHSGDGGAPLGAGRGFVMTAEGPTLTGFNSAYRTSSTSDTVSMNYSWWAVGE